jgi:hypothetical protein
MKIQVDYEISRRTSEISWQNGWEFEQRFDVDFIASAGFEPTNLVSNGKHANHYTNDATCALRSANHSWSPTGKLFTSIIGLINLVSAVHISSYTS